MKILTYLLAAATIFAVASCQNNAINNDCEKQLKETQARLDTCSGNITMPEEATIALTGNCTVDGGSGYRLKDYYFDFTWFNVNGRIVLRKVGNNNDSCSCNIAEGSFIYIKIYKEALTNYRKVKFLTTKSYPANKTYTDTLSIYAGNPNDGLHFVNNSRFAPAGTTTYKWVGTEDPRDGATSDWHEAFTQNFETGFKRYTGDASKIIFQAHVDNYQLLKEADDNVITAHTNPVP
jgi:hypothetical protein